jgi:hypothetical protein
MSNRGGLPWYYGLNPGQETQFLYKTRNPDVNNMNQNEINGTIQHYEEAIQELNSNSSGSGYDEQYGSVNNSTADERKKAYVAGLAILKNAIGRRGGKKSRKSRSRKSRSRKSRKTKRSKRRH